MPFGIGPTEIVILLVIALLVFGPKRLPEMGRSLGRGIREFKDSVTGHDDDRDHRTELPPAEPTVAAPPPRASTPTPSSAPSRERDSF